MLGETTILSSWKDTALAGVIVVGGIALVTLWLEARALREELKQSQKSAQDITGELKNHSETLQLHNELLETFQKNIEKQKKEQRNRVMSNAAEASDVSTIEMTAMKPKTPTG